MTWNYSFQFWVMLYWWLCQEALRTHSPVAWRYWCLFWFATFCCPYICVTEINYLLSLNAIINKNFDLKSKQVLTYSPRTLQRATMFLFNLVVEDHFAMDLWKCRTWAPVAAGSTLRTGSCLDWALHSSNVLSSALWISVSPLDHWFPGMVSSCWV